MPHYKSPHRNPHSDPHHSPHRDPHSAAVSPLLLAVHGQTLVAAAVPDAYSSRSRHPLPHSRGKARTARRIRTWLRRLLTTRRAAAACPAYPMVTTRAQSGGVSGT